MSTQQRHGLLTLFGLAAIMLLPSTARTGEAVPPDLEKRKPEVVANWKLLGDRVQANIAQYEPYLYRKLNAYWTDVAPAIDGKLDDRCWAEAEVAGDFIQEQSFEQGLKLSANPTEVRICYDASNLYVAYRLHDKHMDKLSLGQPPDYRDIIEPNGNAIELFLDTTPGDDRLKSDQNENRFFQIAVNPRGSTYDSRGYGGLEWNPNWETKTSLQKDCWIVEIRLPFRCLNYLSEPTATPKTGEVWGALFCRDFPSPQEWSRWTATGVPPFGGYANVRGFGRLVFSGRKNGGVLPAVAIDSKTRLNFGRNELAFTVQGKVTGGRFTLTRNGKEAATAKVKAGGEIKVPVEISEGGDLQARVVLNSPSGPVYEFNIDTRLPMALATLDAVKNDTARLLQRLKEMPPQVAGQMPSRCEEFAREAVRLREIFDAGKVDAAALATFNKLYADWHGFAFDAERINVYPAGAAAQPFTAIPVDAYTKIFPAKLPTGGRLKEVGLQAAGNDRESFQIMIVPFWTGLDRLEIAVQPFSNGTHTIAAANVEVFRMGYAQHDINYRKILPGYNPDDPESNLNWPDVLLPVSGGAVAVPDKGLSTLWFNVLCPAGTPAGSYRGGVTLSANGFKQTVPVTLEASGFDIPRHPTLRRNTWLDYSYYMRVFYGAEYGKKLDNFPDFLKVYEADLQLLEKYRLGQYPYGPVCWTWIKAWLEPDGRYTYDFTELAAVIRLGRKYGANWFTASFGCNPAGVSPIANGSLPVTERATGKKFTLRECPNMKDRYGKDGYLAVIPGDVVEPNYGPTYASPAYRDFLPQFVSFLKETGMLEESYVEQYDEAKPSRILPGHRALRQIAPGLPLMNEGPVPDDESLGVRAMGYADRWEPGLSAFDDSDVLTTLKNRRSNYGETYGFYVCAAMERADNLCSPYIKISQPSDSPRILGWFGWKYDINHMLVFMQYAGIPEKGWTPDKPPVSAFPGYSPLTYPAPDFTQIPTIRLASLRDGLEDYEYFRLLHGLTAYLDKHFPPHQELRKRIDAELVIGPDICKNSLEWTADAGKLQAKRAQVIKLIAETQAAIAGYPEAVTKKQ